ncbi:MAG: hypothetical protein E7035_01975 [Verrucomicrobiaceae bacterium]|nr:hypothetical protein [Verrucomicrobiaceae bacterium]
MKKFFCLLFFVFAMNFTFASALFDNVTVITKSIDGAEKKSVRILKKQPDGAYRFRIPIKDLTRDILHIDIIGDFAKAKVGEDGYFVMPPNSIGSFVHESGIYHQRRMGLPIFGMKNPRATWVAIVKGLRFEFEGRVEVENGNYVQFPRFLIKDIEFAPYEDLIVDFYELKGDNANYCGMGKAYRKYQLDRGEVKPIKERIKTSPSLKFTTESIFMRIKHGTKRPDKNYPTQTLENEPFIPTAMDFDGFMKKMQEIYDRGMRKVEMCFVGWNIGGFDGRFPDLFPPEPKYGGEAKMKEAIAMGKRLGFQMTNHVCNTDFYRVAKRFDEYAISKMINGNMRPYAFMSGGRAYNPCFQVVCDRYVDEDYEGLNKLGFTCGTQHIDVTSAIMPYTCHDPRHPCNRKQTADYQNKIGEKCRKYFGGFSSEAGYDHVAKTLDYVLYTNTFFRRKDKGWRVNHLLDDRTIPLWQIIYHGIILSNSDWDTVDFYRPLKNIPECTVWRRLQFWEYGGRPSFYWYNGKYMDEVQKIYERYQPMIYLQYEFMDFHGEIAPQVFVTRYSDGSEVITNYTKQQFSYKGEVVPAEDFKLFKNKK